MSILQTSNLKKYYGTEPNITRALDGVTLSVEEGEFVAVVGTSGSGKSTLLHMMGGLDMPTSGSVLVRDRELAKMNDEQLTIFRRRNIGFVFQNYNLVPILNADRFCFQRWHEPCRICEDGANTPCGYDGSRCCGASYGFTDRAASQFGLCENGGNQQ